MPSTVGLQRSEKSVVEQAIKLELDCVAAYAQAAKSSRTPYVAQGYANLANDCRVHAQRWQGQLTALGGPVAGPNCLTEPLNRFKVKAASIFGDRTVARAVHNNPADSREAYERVCGRADLSQTTRDMARSFLPDAHRHLLWVEEMLQPARLRAVA